MSWKKRKKHSLGRISSVSTRASAGAPLQTVATDIHYLPFGPASGFTQGNGAVTAMEYDLDYRLSRLTANGGKAIMNLQYGYDVVNNITAINDHAGGDSQSFGYDALNRLEEASGPYGLITYAYDANGNRLGKIHTEGDETTIETYEIDAGSNRLLRVLTQEDSETDIRQFDYDASGNTIVDTDNERNLSMTVNYNNRLAAMNKDGQRVGDYIYNALGQRVSKTASYRGRLHSNWDQQFSRTSII